MNNSIIRCPVKIRNILNINRRCLSSKVEDVVTHTGQQWESDDYRMVRYINSTKLVNPNWAIKLIEATPIKKVHTRIVWCDGGSGPEGHPRVYINLDKPGVHTCGYCGLRYEKSGKH